MATIDYKQKIKDYMNSSEVDTLYKSMLNNLFPELKESKESEDEKMLRVLREGFNILDKDEEWYSGITNGQILAWLEKQGKQKPIDKAEPKFKVGDVVINKKTKDTVKIVQILHDSYCYSGWDGAATCYCDFSISEQDDWELVEQKPTEDSAKVSEFSTEEKDMGEYKKGFECGKQRVLKYPEDFGLCKKPAWSEEDERMLNLIVQDYLDWLKSLSHQSHWKPTKEQIMALRWVLNHIPYDSHKEEISGLLDQIKDL